MSAKMLKRTNKTPSRYYNVKENGLRNKKKKRYTLHRVKHNEPFPPKFLYVSQNSLFSENLSYKLKSFCAFLFLSAFTVNGNVFSYYGFSFQGFGLFLTCSYTVISY